VSDEPSAMRVEGEELPVEVRRRVRFKPARLYGRNRLILEFLRSHAGLWCRVREIPESDTAKAHALYSCASHHSAHAGFAGCEFAVRTVGGKRVLFGRYMGQPNAEVA
jgi:hypothetical protein